MKANVISLKSVRNEFKSVNVATIGNVLSVIYSLVNEYKEKQNELNNEEKSDLANLVKVLPQSKTQAKKYIAEIEKFGNVGGTRTIKRADGTTREYTIKPSIDMVLRFFVAEYNKNVPEAKVEKKHIKHECATRKQKECKAEKKQTANTIK